MKKNILKLLPVLLLGLTACGGGGGSSSGGGSSIEPTPTTKDVTVLVYIDYNHADEDNPYHKSTWYFNTTFTQSDIELADPKPEDANYTEFNTFKGWSLHPIIDNDDQLFKWGEFKKEKDGTPPYVILYGIWVDASK